MTPSKTLLVGLTATAALGLGILWSSTSSADSHRSKSPAPAVTSAAVITPAAGRVLAGNCFQCHGTNGRGGPWEGLAGESSGELYSELKEFQTKTGGDDAIMSVHAQSYSDAQLRAIADFFSKAK